MDKELEGTNNTWNLIYRESFACEDEPDQLLNQKKEQMKMSNIAKNVEDPKSVHVFQQQKEEDVLSLILKFLMPKMQVPLRRTWTTPLYYKSWRAGLCPAETCIQNFTISPHNVNATTQG